MKNVTKTTYPVNSNIPKLAAQIKANPDDSFSKFALALELIKENQPNKALTLFQNIRQQTPNYIGVYYHLAKLYIDLGENNLAIETYKEGIEIANTISDLHAKSELQGALMNLQLDIDD